MISTRKQQSGFAAAVVACMAAVAIAAIVPTTGRCAEPVSGLSKGIYGEIRSDGPFRYRIGEGPWMRQSDGEFPVATPFVLESEESHCRIDLGVEGVLEAGGSTNLRVKHSEKGPLRVVLAQGGFLYSIPRGTTLEISIAGQSTKLVAGEGAVVLPSHADLANLPPAPGVASRVVRARYGDEPSRTLALKASNHLGIVLVGADGAVQANNLQGALAWENEQGVPAAVGPGRTVELRGKGASSVQLVSETPTGTEMEAETEEDDDATTAGWLLAGGGSGKWTTIGSWVVAGAVAAAAGG